MAATHTCDGILKRRDPGLEAEVGFIISRFHGKCSSLVGTSDRAGEQNVALLIASEKVEERALLAIEMHDAQETANTLNQEEQLEQLEDGEYTTCAITG